MAANYSVDFVVPCYHEEAALPVTVPAILSYARGLIASGRVRADRFRVILVDDGSRDATWPVIVALAKAHDEVSGIKLSRNYGHQSAILAGLSQATADAAITMDADLQDDIAAIESMLLRIRSRPRSGARRSRQPRVGYRFQARTPPPASTACCR